MPLLGDGVSPQHSNKPRLINHRLDSVKEQDFNQKPEIKAALSRFLTRERIPGRIPALPSEARGKFAVNEAGDRGLCWENPFITGSGIPAGQKSGILGEFVEEE